MWRVEPYTAYYPKGISPIDDSILKMSFTKESHVYQVSVGSQVVTNKLQELYVSTLGAGLRDRRYHSEATLQEEVKNLANSTFESSIKPIISALEYMGEKPKYEETVHLYLNATAPGPLINGDVLKNINHKVVKTSGDIQNLLNEKPTLLTLEIERSGRPVRISMTAEEFAASANASNMRVGTRVDVVQKLPIQTYYDSEMQGDSNGLAKAIEIIHQFSTKDLIMDRKIIATGSIQVDGTITRVGGLEYKLLALEDEKFDIFLVPESNRTEVEMVLNSGMLKRVGGEIRFVKNIHEVISLLEQTRSGDKDDKVKFGS
ncbi:hypothetical protein POF51_25915 [Brevibacillus sp. AG]|uniref:S16 family serine protease n=1 Tax=Brevibacillus sp. AG TaxID=3020891 RepID=UPI00232EA043|nr:S16 family serine protease [Brevibacillus sp. AG]MDC0764160.1 hypothetical protein [Brevibacillus sp. AG]